MTAHEHSETPAPAEYWEDRYGGSEQMWSGRVNAVLADVASTLPAGRALDLGCGEGGDVIWLAQRGWAATGIDISATAVRRAAEAAHAAGLDASRAEFRVADLSQLELEDRFDLVTTSFLHSPVELPRERILRLAAERVAPGGHLLITSHAAPPPWARDEDEHEHRHDDEHERRHADMNFPSPEEDLAALELDGTEWETRLLEVRERFAVGPDGAEAVLSDGVVLVRRRGA
ncbi:MAG: class I SAM-dependent methyltransferase [Leucobacter sp.]|nr:class I SAM-dependent methyltransferase [Leucobacter sp.]